MVKEQNATIHFVDDRYETVKAVAGEPSLSKVQVYMADWFVTTQKAFRKRLAVLLLVCLSMVHKAPFHSGNYDSVQSQSPHCSRW